MAQQAIEQILEAELHKRVIQAEGSEAIGAKIFWNWQNCPYYGKCYIQKFMQAGNTRACLYNPKMFKCSAYQYYESADAGAAK